jgi:glycosyltransferase involved in cell wall biosynthesis
MDDLYQQADVFVSASRGEGFGFGFIEALKRGIPIITPDLYMDNILFTEANSILVPSQPMICVGGEFAGLTHKIIWNEVSTSKLAETMRHVYEEYPFVLPVEVNPEYVKEEGLIESKLLGVINGAS